MAIATRDASPAHLLLKIESFSLLDKYGIDKYESQEFDAANNKWRLVIYPKGNGTEKSGDFFSVYLAISGTDTLPENWEVNAIFSIFILDQISGSYHHTTWITRRYFGLKTEWGVPNFISKQDLTTQSKGYLIDDTCLFGAEVFVRDSNTVVKRSLSLKDAKVTKHSLKISNFSTLKDIWYSEEFTTGGYTWKIRLYPNGIGDEIGRSISIFLVHVASDNNKCDERVRACFSICMKNQLDPQMNLKKTYSRWFGASAYAFGWRAFHSKAKVNEENGGFIVNDTCLLEIENSVLAIAQ